MRGKLLLFVLLGSFSSAMSQSAYEQGSKLLDAGVGLGSPFWGAGFSRSLPFNPRLAAEYGVTDQISIGVGVAFSGAEVKYAGYDVDQNYNVVQTEETYKYKACFIAVRGAYHFWVDSDQWDPYTGASLGYVIVSAGDESSGLSKAASGTGYGAFAGARYYFNAHIAANAELGYSSFSFLTIGLSFKL